MATVGLLINPAAGRDIRRLTGGASVSDDYAKRRVVTCVLEGLTLADEPIEVRAMPDRAGLGHHAVENAPEGIAVSLLDIGVDGEGDDTRRAAERLREEADAVVVLGGDGTNLDVAHGIGDVPLVSISTGTNNVVPTPLDGTAAGVAAGFVASGAVPTAEVTYRHGMVEATVESGPNEDRTVRGLATLGLIDRQFVGAGAVSEATEFLGGVVSRADPANSGLSGIVGSVTPHAPTAPGGVGVRLRPPGEAHRVVRAITAPGIVERIGVRECRRLDEGETITFDLDSGVLSTDGEPHLELTDAAVSIRPVPEGPRFVEPEAAFEAASERELFAVR